MCRSIKRLRGEELGEDAVREAALQYVRKVSGYRAPSRANEQTFDAAVEEVTDATRKLLESLVVGRSRTA